MRSGVLPLERTSVCYKFKCKTLRRCRTSGARRRARGAHQRRYSGTGAAERGPRHRWLVGPEIGMRSCAHWLSINVIGVDVWNGGEMVRAGHALEGAPGARTAFAEAGCPLTRSEPSPGSRRRTMTRWCLVALRASGAQLARICRSVKQALDADDPRRAGDALLNRGVRTWWRDDGMLQLMAVLPREDGAVVVAALEAAAHPGRNRTTARPSPDQPELAAEHRTHPMLAQERSGSPVRDVDRGGCNRPGCRAHDAGHRPRRR